MFRSLKVSTRLLIILVTSCAAVVLVGLIGIASNYATRSELYHLFYGDVDKIDELTIVQEQINSKFLEPLRHLSQDGSNWQETRQNLQLVVDQANANWNRYLENTPELAPEFEGIRNQIVQRVQALFQEWNRSVVVMQDAFSKLDKSQSVNLLALDGPRAANAIVNEVNALIHLQVKDTFGDYKRGMENALWYQYLTIGTFLLTLATLIPLTIYSSRGIIKPLQNAIDYIAVSQEIKTSLAHLSSGTTETASAVTETTTTIEELKQTADVSVEKAKDVLTNAQETLQAVSSSEKSVTATLEDISQIRDRMQVISDSILKLSEKSLAIAEIMDSVSDIAEQSNLLAVNAAIEAAKAGEAGRSFAIVAQEIRTLAEQSKGATVQVRSLLNDIQSATHAAVLATEQGSKAVAKGVSQSTQTNTTIQELAGKMGRVAQAANQIVLSNQQQRVGTEQITVAMTQINEATNQHVEHLKQIESAVDMLNQVGDVLKELSGNTSGPSAPPFNPIRQVPSKPVKVG